MSDSKAMDTIKYFMEDDIVSVDTNATVHDTVQLMNEKRIGAVLVSEGDDYKGIFTETDLLRKVIAPGTSPADVKVHTVMSSPLQMIDCESTMVAAFIIMQQKNIRHLAVTQKKKVIGILSIKDIANYYVNKFRPK